jgi:hypothetical protein
MSTIIGCHFWPGDRIAKKQVESEASASPSTRFVRRFLAFRYLALSATGVSAT